MTPEAGFLLDICENPDDNLPRLVYADWLEEQGDAARAEFIRVQCCRAGMSDGHPEALALRDRAEVLLRQNWDAWVRPLARLLGRPREGWLRTNYHPEALYKFRRGFVYILDLDAEWLVDHSDELFRLAPLRHARLFGAGRCAGRLAQCRQLDWLRCLDFADYYTDPVDARAMVSLAASPHLGRLRHLGLYNNHLGDHGAAALAQAGWLAGVGTVELGETGLSVAGVRALAETPRPFRPWRLGLSRNQVGDAGARALADSPVLSAMRHLMLDRCGIGRVGVAALAASPHLGELRSLDLSGNPFLREPGWFDVAPASWWGKVRTDPSA